MNRANRRDVLFFNDHDFDAFERVLFQAKVRFDMPLFDYAVMRNHFHLVVRPAVEGQLSRFMHWLTMTHTQRWHIDHGTTGTGALYQGRYKALPVQADRHFLMVMRYVERNPVRAGLVERVEDWRWSGAWRMARNCTDGLLDDWPVTRPASWIDLVNEAERPNELSDLREAVTRSAPFGNARWAADTARDLGILQALRGRGRRREFRRVRIDPESPLIVMD
jgi:putative transposase